MKCVVVCQLYSKSLQKLCLYLGIWVLVWGSGCPTRKVKPTFSPPRSERPVVHLVRHAGARLQYNVYNTSSRTFQGLAIVMEGDQCTGPRSHRLSIQLSKPPLQMGHMRTLTYRMSYMCKNIRFKAFDRLSFQKKIREDHRPIVHFRHRGRDVYISIRNSSILPLRGIALQVVGRECADDAPEQRWSGGTKLWLYPGYKRDFTLRLNVACAKVQISAVELIRLIQFQKRRRNIANQLLKEL